MTEDEDSDNDVIHRASEDAPIFTNYEPDFQRVFARGTLLRKDEDDDNTVQMAFWSSKDKDIQVEESEKNGTGYRLETEVMMNWDGVLRLRELLDNYIEDHAPDRHLEDFSSSDD